MLCDSIPRQRECGWKDTRSVSRGRDELSLNLETLLLLTLKYTIPDGQGSDVGQEMGGQGLTEDRAWRGKGSGRVPHAPWLCPGPPASVSVLCPRLLFLQLLKAFNKHLCASFPCGSAPEGPGGQCLPPEQVELGRQNARLYKCNWFTGGSVVTEP